MGFKSGISGNVSGRPVGFKSIRRLAADRAAKAISLLDSVLDDHQADPLHRIEAARVLLNLSANASGMAKAE